VEELESYNPAAPDLERSGSLTRSRSSSSSGSSRSGVRPRPISGVFSSGVPEHLHNNQVTAHEKLPLPEHGGPEESNSESEDETDDDDGNAPLPPASVYAHSQPNRPQSSLSSHRYRTPMASMMMTPPVLSMSVPPSQPMPRYETPSAFDRRERSSPSIPSSGYPTTTVTYPGGPASSRTDLTSPNTYPSYQRPATPPQFVGRGYPLPSGMTPRPASRPTELERVLGIIQVNLQALKERLEALENMAHRSTSSLIGSRSPGQMTGQGNSLSGARSDDRHFNVDDMGMWSILLSPLSRVAGSLRYLLDFLASSETRSPTFIVIRRLFLDISFLLCVLACMRLMWRRTGIRRKEVLAALGGVWRAILGHKKPRMLVDKAV